MTSLVIESLALFASSDLWDILKDACQIKDYSNPGNLIDIDFWPHWKPDGVHNLNYVEPDVFMNFDNLSIIFEVKKNDSTAQSVDQWEKEVNSFHKTYVGNTKPLILVAINGNSSIQSEEINGIDIYKTSWARLCDAALKRNEKLSKYHRKWMEDSFKVIGVTPYCAISTWLESACLPNINENAIKYINKVFSVKHEL